MRGCRRKGHGGYGALRTFSCACLSVSGMIAEATVSRAQKSSNRGVRSRLGAPEGRTQRAHTHPARGDDDLLGGATDQVGGHEKRRGELIGLLFYQGLGGDFTTHDFGVCG